LSVDYAAVAGSIVLGIPGVRACLVVSADGLPLAVHPPTEEEAATALWTRLSALGEISRGFVTVRTEVWAFVQGERYGALVLADRSVRPGQVLELADQALAEAAAAAEVRAAMPGTPMSTAIVPGSDRRIDTVPAPREPRSPTQRRFRVPLHREERPGEPEPVTLGLPAEVVAIADVERSEATGPDAAQSATPEGVASDTATLAPPWVTGTTDATPPEMDRGTGSGSGTGEAAGATEVPGPAREEVDIIALAREFSGLLTERDDGSA
jgi:hypothetical protein